MSAIHILSFLLAKRRPPTPTLFPYTTLFRSANPYEQLKELTRGKGGINKQSLHAFITKLKIPEAAKRSEEHTSELQSPVHLVCRLLLEKKKRYPQISTRRPYREYCQRNTAYP